MSHIASFVKIAFVAMILIGTYGLSYGSRNETSRREISLNNDWHFRFSHEVDRSSGKRVDLPHTWNTVDALVGEQDYKRGIGNYTKRIRIDEDLQGKRIYIKSDGANSVANLFVNGRHVGEHRGGYSAFVFDITDYVEFGKDNTLLFRVNNAEQLDVMPLVGDFNFYGGLYRDVNMIVADPVSISLLDYGSSGVYLRQERVNVKIADVVADVMLSNSSDRPEEVVVRVSVAEGEHPVVSREKKVAVQPSEKTRRESVAFAIDNPHLWNGKDDPFVYNVEVALIKDGKEIDRIVQPLGLRYFHTDPDKGFFLNGKHLSLHGVCRHQERAEVGNALRPEHHDEDMALMLDMGANAMRLAHYQQSDYIYSLADKTGMAVWAEIPFVGPG